MPENASGQADLSIVSGVVKGWKWPVFALAWIRRTCNKSWLARSGSTYLSITLAFPGLCLQKEVKSCQET